MSMTPSMKFLGLLPVLLCGCYQSGNQQTDVETMEDADSVEFTDVDINENAQDTAEIDGEDAPLSCEFGSLMDPVQLTFHTRHHYHAAMPAMVFTGSEFAIVWLDNRNTLGEKSELFFTALAPSGEKVIEDYQLSYAADPGSVGMPDAVFTGSEIGVVFTKSTGDEPLRRDLHFMRLAPNGSLIGNETRPTMDYPERRSHMPFIAFSGDEYGIMWNLDQSLMFMRLDREGNHLGEDLVLDPDIYMSFSLIHAAGEYVMVWDENSDGERIAFARISDEGIMVDGPRDLTLGSLDNCPSIAFSGTEYGVVYESPTLEPFDSNVYFFRLSMDGQRLISEDIRLTDDSEYVHYPKIIHNGSEYAVVWLNNNDPGGVYLDRLDEEGTMKGDSFKIADTLINSNRFQIVPAGPDYAAVWEHGQNLMFGRFGCLDRADP